MTTSKCSGITSGSHLLPMSVPCDGDAAKAIWLSATVLFRDGIKSNAAMPATVDLSLFVPGLLSTELSRSDAHDPAEDFGEVALIHEPRGLCNVTNLDVMIVEEHLRTFNPIPQ